MDKQLGRKSYLDIVDIAFRRKWFFIIPFIVIIMMAMGYVRWAPKSYKASTTILVEQPELPTSYVRPTIIERRQGRLETVEQQIKSRRLIEVIVDEYYLLAEPKRNPSPPSGIQGLRDRITIQVTGDQIFSISYEDRNPVMAMKIANRLASLFIERSLKQREERALGTISFLDRELERVQKLLKQQEKDISEFRTSQIGVQPGDNGVDSDDLIVLYTLLRRLRLKYTDEHPEIIRLKAKIAEVEKTKSKEGTDKSEVQLSREDLEQTQLKAEKKRLWMDQRMNELIRDYEVTQEEYQSLLDKKHQAELAASMEEKQKEQRFLVLDEAKIPASPFSPNRQRFLLIGLLFAIAGGIGLVYVREHLDTSFYKIEDLEIFAELPVIAGISKIRKKKIFYKILEQSKKRLQ